MKTIEVEFRARFSEQEYLRLLKYLDTRAKNLGVDDKNVHFFVLPRQLLKVVHNVSKGTAKVVLKLNSIGEGSAFDEIEYEIPIDSMENAIRLFKEINYIDKAIYIESFQKRVNYIFEDVELSLKYSENWGHHLELEIVVDDETKVQDAEAKIKTVARILGVELMSDDELKKFTKKIQSSQGKMSK